MHNKELERLLAVDRYLKLKISKEDELLEIVEAAASICGTPIALINLLDKDTQFTRVSVGANIGETSRNDVFCNHVIIQEEVLVVPDTGKDYRFIDNPFRTSSHDVQFYAGAPLVTQDGLTLGSLCVMDHKPKDLSTHQIMMLKILSKQVIHVLEFDYSLQIMKEQYLKAKENEFTLRSLFESSKSCLLLLDINMHVLFFNKVLSDVMDMYYHRNILIGDCIADLLKPEILEVFMEDCKRALNGESILKESLITYGAKSIWWQLNFEPAYDNEGKVIGVSHTAIDISELKNSQFKTIEREQSLHAIALIQSHEIRRPVSSIIGLTNLMKENDYTAEKEEIIMLERAVHELDDRIHDIVNHTSDKKSFDQMI